MALKYKIGEIDSVLLVNDLDYTYMFNSFNNLAHY